SGRQWAGGSSLCLWVSTGCCTSMRDSPGPQGPKRELLKDSLWITPARNYSSSSATRDPTAAIRFS
ncbi:hypothetical protein M9458_017915, partial [Cirrhinus mrigala]